MLVIIQASILHDYPGTEKSEAQLTCKRLERTTKQQGDTEMNRATLAFGSITTRTNINIIAVVTIIITILYKFRTLQKILRSKPCRESHFASRSTQAPEYLDMVEGKFWYTENKEL